MRKGDSGTLEVFRRHVVAAIMTLVRVNAWSVGVGQPISPPTFDVIVYPTKDVEKRHF